MTCERLLVRPDSAGLTSDTKRIGVRFRANSASRSGAPAAPCGGEEDDCLFFPTLSQKFMPAHGSRKPAGRVSGGKWQNPRVESGDRNCCRANIWSAAWLWGGAAGFTLQISKKRYQDSLGEETLACNCHREGSWKVAHSSLICFGIETGTSGSSLPASPPCLMSAFTRASLSVVSLER